MAATVREICDAVVTKVAAFWTPIAPNEVVRTYLPDVTEATGFLGRRVWVAPLDYGQADIASRAEDRNSFTVGVTVAERFTDAGRPTRAWCDTRIDFVADLWELLTAVRNPPLFPSPLDDVIAITGEVDIAFDPDLLREKKVFFSQLTLTYERDEA